MKTRIIFSFTLIALFSSCFWYTIPTFAQQTTQSPIPIGDTDYKVGPGTYTPIQFTLSCTASVSGTFSSTAGLGNDIMVYVFDQNNLQKFTGNSYTAYYQSGKVGTGSFNINLTPGTYYIVLSNLYSSFSTKNVHIQVSYTCN